MPATKFNDYVSDLAFHVTGVMDHIAVDALRHAFTEFCNRTKSWHRRVEITLIEGQSEYDLPPKLEDDVTTDNPDARVLEFTDVFVDKYAINAVFSQDILDDATGEPMHFYRTGLNQLQLFPTPGATVAGKTMAVEMALTPTPTATTFDDTEIKTMFMDYIVHGAAGRLLAMPGKPWSDPRAAGAYLQRFEQGMFEAMRHFRRYASKVPLRVQYGGI